VISGWAVLPLTDFVAQVVDRCGSARPAVVALNGHSSSGKTTLSARLSAALPGSDVLHTDDLAWHHGVFAWDTLLLADVLPVVRSGEPLDYRPPQWIARQRSGSVRLPGDLQYLVVEGVGASQRSVRDAFDAVIWVETEEVTRLARDVVRVEENGEMSVADFHSWMAEENAYVVAERPWESADWVVYGGTAISHDPETDVVVARLSR
jgi:uridine kinase